MSINKSSGGLRFVRHRKRNNPPPKDPFFGGTFDYIEGGNSKHRRRGHRHKEGDGGPEKDWAPVATIADERRKHRVSHANSSEANVEDHHEQTRREVPQMPVPLSSGRVAPSEHDRGDSDTDSYVRERPAPSEHGRGERHVTFRAPVVTFIGPSAPSSYSYGENDIGSSDRKRPAPSEQRYGERVVCLKERPVPNRYDRGVRETVYDIRQRPVPNRYGCGESNVVFYIRERPAPSRYGRGKTVVSYSRERPAPSKQGRGGSDIVTYIIERPAAELPQPPDAHRMAGDRAPSPNLGRHSGLPAWRAPSPVRRKPAPPEGTQPVGKANSPPAPLSNPTPKETPDQDNKQHVQPEKRVYKRVVYGPSLAGFSRWISPPYSCKKSNDFPPPRNKYAMSGALGSPPPVKRRSRSPAKPNRIADNDDIVRSISPPCSKCATSGALQSPERRPRSPTKRERSPCNDDIVRNLSPPCNKYEMSGALGSPPPVRRRPRSRSPTKLNQLANKDEIIRNISPPCNKYEINGALGSPPPMKRRPRSRSPTKPDQSARNEDIPHNSPPPYTKYEMSGALQSPERRSSSLKRRPTSPRPPNPSSPNDETLTRNNHRCHCYPRHSSSNSNSSHHSSSTNKNHHSFSTSNNRHNNRSSSTSTSNSSSSSNTNSNSNNKHHSSNTSNSTSSTDGSGSGSSSNGSAGKRMRKKGHVVQINQNLNVVLEKRRDKKGKSGVTVKVKD